MNDFVLLLIVGVCWCWGVFTLFHEGYILNPIGENLKQTGLPKWLSKPLFDCPPCMGSIHGFIISAIYFEWHIVTMAAYMICLCGLNFIVKSILFPEYE